MGDDEVRLLTAQLKSLTRRLRRESPAAGGLSATALLVLGAVVRSAPGATPGRITEQLQMTTSNVSAALRELDAAGVVTRRQDPADKRRVVVEVTGMGQRLVAQSRAGREAWLRAAIEAELDADEQRVLVHAGQLIARVADHHAPGRQAADGDRRETR